GAENRAAVFVRQPLQHLIASVGLTPGMDRQGEDLNLVALRQADDIPDSVQASGVVTVAEEHDDALRKVIPVKLRKLAETGGEQAVVEVGGVTRLLNPLQGLVQGS